MSYVDGFVITVPKKNLAAYKKMAIGGGKMWMKYGALQYVECVGDDMTTAQKWGAKTFPEIAGAKKTDIVIFSFIVFKSKAHRNQVNAKVMKDPSMNDVDQPMPFKMEHMAYGGFKPIVVQP